MELAGPASPSLIGGLDAQTQARGRDRPSGGDGGRGARRDRHQQLLVLLVERPLARAVDARQHAERLASEDQRHEDRLGRIGRELLELGAVRIRGGRRGVPVSSTWPASEPSTGSRGCDSERARAAADGGELASVGEVDDQRPSRHDLPAVAMISDEDALEVGLAADRPSDLGERLEPPDAAREVAV